MVKLATAREARMYGPALAVRRWEYINAGAYAFAALLLAAALAAVTAGGGAYSSSRAALAVAAVALSLVAAVNAHDLAAHVAGVDCRVGLARYDVQLGLVELLAPALHAAGCVVGVVGIALLLSHSQGEGAGRHAANALLAAALLWLLGSVLNSCQVYERADARAQLLQSSVHLPLLLGSLLFLVAAVLNRRRVLDLGREPVLVGRSWAWLSLAGSLLWLMAAACNMVKVKMMHQSDALRLEKLRCGAQERLSRDREGRVPLVWEDQAARRSALPAELR